MTLLQILQSVVPCGTIGGTLGAAIVTIAAAFGISKIGSSAMDAIARQPEAAPHVRSSMIIVAAFVEGVSFFAVVVCFMALS